MYDNILVPVDLAHGDLGERILRLAHHIGRNGAKVTILHVLGAVPAYIEAQIPDDVVREHSEDVRGKLGALARVAGSGAEIIIRSGSPGATILDVAEEIGADAIVLASHRPNISDYFIGSTAARVVRHASCSVVVDRSGSS